MRHEPVLRLALRHPYWPDGRCRAFTVRPAASTMRLARNHRLLIRPRPDGVHVAGPVEPDGRAFIPLPADATFTFYLTLNDAEFPHYTSPDGRGTTFANPADAPELTPAAGADPLPKGVYASAAIRHGDATGFREYTIGFAARHVRWAYYLLTDLGADAADFALVTSPGNGPSTVSFGAARDLASEPDAADAVAAGLAADHPDRRRLRFLSDQPVAAARRSHRIELRLGGERLAGPLPNPRLSTRSTVPVAGTPETAVYDIVAYPPVTSISTGG